MSAPNRHLPDRNALVTFITPADPSSSAESRPPLDRPCSGNIRARLPAGRGPDEGRWLAGNGCASTAGRRRLLRGISVSGDALGADASTLWALICALSRHSSRRPDRSGARCRPRSTRTQVYERTHPPAVCDGRRWEPGGGGSRGRRRGRGWEREQRAGAGQSREKMAGRAERRGRGREEISSESDESR